MEAQTRKKEKEKHEAKGIVRMKHKGGTGKTGEAWGEEDKSEEEG